jgi:apolipoprotein N-acyltransferase
LKIPALSSALIKNSLLAMVVGLLQASAFPKIGIDWVGWVAPGLLFILGLGQNTGGKAFRIGYCAGLAHYLLSLYWLLLIPLPVKAILAWLAVSAILALYSGCWTWLCWKTFPKLQLQPHGKSSDLREGSSYSSLLGYLNSITWRQRALWTFTCACAWVAIEMAITRLLTGFPWNLLGASQYRHLELIQIASLTGVYGVSFLIVWVSVSLAVAVSRACRDKAGFQRCALDLALPTIILGMVIGFGMYRLSRPEPTGRELKLALIQPSIPQLILWDESEKSNRFNKLVALSQEAAASHPDVLVWPEAALPNTFTRFNLRTYGAITNLVVPNHLWMIFGADDAEPKKDPRRTSDADFFNSAFLVDPNGQLLTRYHKRRLVMFGEYLPLARWFPFLKYLRRFEGGFTAGEAPVPFQLTGLGAKISVLICFEDVFPHLARESVSEDTDFMINLTNNGWFRESAAQWQHAVSALFRAVENGLPLVRCTNNGLTCWIDAYGRLHEVYFEGTRDIYGAGFKLVTVPLRANGKNQPLTVYHRYGDWFGWACLAMTVLCLLNPWIRKRL